jgi:hypothetical protein
VDVEYQSTPFPALLSRGPIHCIFVSKIRSTKTSLEILDSTDIYLSGIFHIACSNPELTINSCACVLSRYFCKFNLAIDEGKINDEMKSKLNQ